MNNERYYDESEVQEILALAGAKPTTSELLETNDLIKAAGEIGISANVVGQAVQQVYGIREEAADRKEFARLQILYFALAIIVTSTVFAVFRNSRVLQNNFQIFIMYALLGSALLIRGMRSGTSQYEIGFYKWRLKRIKRVDPEYVRSLAEGHLIFQLQTAPQRSDQEMLLRLLRTEYRYSRAQGIEILKQFRDAHPEFNVTIDTAEGNYLIGGS